MFESHQYITDQIPCWFVPRGIRAGFGRAGALVLLLSVIGCQSPGSATPQANESAAEDKEQAAAEAFSAKELEPEVSLRSAADILPETLLTGPYHTVRNEVVARGFVHYYVIESPYGEFLAAGDDEVRK